MIRKNEVSVDYAMNYMIDELNTAASKSDVILLYDVWDRYESYAMKYNTQAAGSYKDKPSFTRHLRKRMQGA